MPGFNILNYEKLDKKIVEISEKFGLKLTQRQELTSCLPGEKQRVELLKALYRDVQILILDEPTSVLTSPEVTALFSSLQAMVNSGLSIIFTTHKLEEAMNVSSRITVMRNGRVIAEKAAKVTNPRELANLMIGRDVVLGALRQKRAAGPEILRCQNLSVVNDKGFRIIKDLSIELRQGEILGVAGVAGNGQRELAEAITGCRHMESGQLLMRMSGQQEFTNVTHWSGADGLSRHRSHN